ncbi:hypothetical protein V6N13_074776 [Hibiscus sabdariffa]
MGVWGSGTIQSTSGFMRGMSCLSPSPMEMYSHFPISCHIASCSLPTIAVSGRPLVLQGLKPGPLTIGVIFTTMVPFDLGTRVELRNGGRSWVGLRDAYIQVTILRHPKRTIQFCGHVIATARNESTPLVRQHQSFV